MDEIVQELVRSLRLRSILKMVSEPDQVMDHLLGNHLGLPALAYTEDFELARRWCAIIAEDLILDESIMVTPQMYGVRARIGELDYPVWLAARNPAIPACFAGLNRRIDVLINNSPGMLDKLRSAL